MIKALNLANYIPQMAFFLFIFFSRNCFALYESHLDVCFEKFHIIVTSLTCVFKIFILSELGSKTMSFKGISAQQV